MINKIKNFSKRIINYYFDIKPFEKNGKLYECLGIKWFSKYCGNGGSFWTRRFKGSWIKGRKKEDLWDFIIVTKIYEGIHIVFLPIYTFGIYLFLVNNQYFLALIATIVNLVINVYPIMNQRYNRNKVFRLFSRFEQLA